MVDIVFDMTEGLLLDAGILPGMRVLDVGCGRGDVAHLAAQLVGKDGKVVGVDRDTRALAIARQRAHELGLDNVTFEQGDFASIPPELGVFDAAVGRRVLMYQPDVAKALRGVARVLKAGGLVVFQEHDATMAPARLQPLPLHERVHGWIWRTVEREGGNPNMGFGLCSALEAAGLSVEEIRAEAIVQTPRAHHPVGGILRAMMPRILQHGVATEQEIDVDTIDRRLIEERVKADATYIGEMVFGVWARKPKFVDDSAIRIRS